MSLMVTGLYASLTGLLVVTWPIVWLNLGEVRELVSVMAVIVL